MATVTVNDASLSAIADAIREKLDVETTYLPSQMAAAIESIETGGTDLTSEDEGKVVVESSGEYVLAAQTSRSISQNGTYDTTTNNEVVVSVSGGGGGGETVLYDFDFQNQQYTVQPVFSASAPTIDASGATFTEGAQYICLGSAMMCAGATLIVDMGDTEMTPNGYHRSLITFEGDGNIFGYRNSGNWSTYLGSWTESALTGINALSNKELAIHVSKITSVSASTGNSTATVMIYVDGELLMSVPNVKVGNSLGTLRIGNQRSASSGGNIAGTTIKRARIIVGNPYAGN